MLSNSYILLIVHMDQNEEKFLSYMTKIQKDTPIYVGNMIFSEI